MNERVESTGNDDPLPEEVIERLLEEVLSCPDCCVQVDWSPAFAGPPIDHALARRVARRAASH